MCSGLLCFRLSYIQFCRNKSVSYKQKPMRLLTGFVFVGVLLFCFHWNRTDCSYISASGTFLFVRFTFYWNISTFFTIFFGATDLAFLYMIIFVYACGIVDFIKLAFIFARLFWFLVTTYCTYCFMSTSEDGMTSVYKLLFQKYEPQSAHTTLWLIF